MPRYNNHKKTNRYTQEFKSKPVLLSHLTGVQVKDVAQALDIHPFMLSRWRKEYREGKILADKRKKKIRSYTDKYKIHFKVQLDEDGSVTEPLAVVGVPTLILINKESEITCRQCRSIDIMQEKMF